MAFFAHVPWLSQLSFRLGSRVIRARMDSNRRPTIVQFRSRTPHAGVQIIRALVVMAALRSFAETIGGRASVIFRASEILTELTLQLPAAYPQHVSRVLPLLTSSIPKNRAYHSAVNGLR
jgi:hypothetical protein